MSLETYITTAEDLIEVSEIITALDEMLLVKYQGVRLEHLLSWWAAIGPIEA